MRSQADSVFLSWGADVRTVRASERFGAAVAWVATTRTGAGCVLLTVGAPAVEAAGQVSVIGGGCAPAGQDPTVDVWSDGGSGRLLPGDIGADGDAAGSRTNSWVRFRVHGDAVQVWVTPVAAPA